MSALAMSPLPPGTRIGSDVVEAVLGSLQGYRSALKLVPVEKDEERAWHEALIGTRLNLHHPNLARVLEVGSWPLDNPRFVYLKQELVEGVTLDGRAREHDVDTDWVVDRLLEV